jgi:hypothetical protein
MIASQVNVTQTQLHPIREPEHLLQTRAIGVLKGVISRSGAITLTGGFQGKALILGEKVFGLVQKLLKKEADTAMFTVYPQTKGGVVTRLQVIGVWKPSILASDSGAQDDHPEKFSIRGEVLRVGRSDEHGRYVAVTVFGQYYVTVDFGHAPYLQPGDFVSMDAFLTEEDRLYTHEVNCISVSEAAVARPNQTGRQVRRRSSATT